MEVQDRKFAGGGEVAKMLKGASTKTLQKFSSVEMVKPRQIINHQLIDKLSKHHRQMKYLIGKKSGGAVKTTMHHLDGEEVHIIERRR
jgi:hypothetical protein